MIRGSARKAFLFAGILLQGFAACCLATVVVVGVLGGIMVLMDRWGPKSLTAATPSDEPGVRIPDTTQHQVDSPVRNPDTILSPVSTAPWTAEAEVTAYCPCAQCCGSWSRIGKTSTGRDARTTAGVAVDPTRIPYGSWVEIAGTRYLADDTGGAMRKAGRAGKLLLDIRFPTHQEALNWGRRKLTITVHP